MAYMVLRGVVLQETVGSTLVFFKLCSVQLGSFA